MNDDRPMIRPSAVPSSRTVTLARPVPYGHDPTVDWMLPPGFVCRTQVDQL
jgi:hypothetical protein